MSRMQPCSVSQTSPACTMSVVPVAGRTRSNLPLESFVMGPSSPLPDCCRFRAGRAALRLKCRLGDAVDVERLVAAFDVHRTERSGVRRRFATVAQHFARDEELGAEALVELLDALGEDHYIAGDRILLAQRRADIAA